VLFEERLFALDIARSKRGESPSGARDALRSWACEKVSFIL
jgi:hypothetical protein